jgi:Ca2+-binding RTX toxin-like protein
MVDAYIGEHEQGDSKYLGDEIRIEGLTIATPGYIGMGNWDVTNFWNEDDPINSIPLNAPGDDNKIYFGDTTDGSMLDLLDVSQYAIAGVQHSKNLYDHVINFISEQAGLNDIEELINRHDSIVVPRATDSGEVVIGKIPVGINWVDKYYFYRGEGNDILKGGVGNDLLFGGNGDDTYEFSSINSWGQDTIIDSGGNADVIDIGDSNGSFSIHTYNQDVIIRFTPSNWSPGLFSGGTITIHDYSTHAMKTLRWNDIDYQIEDIKNKGEVLFDPAQETINAAAVNIYQGINATISYAMSAAGGALVNLLDGVSTITDPFRSWFYEWTPLEATNDGENSLIGKTVTLSGFVNVIGTQYNDKLVGDDAANELEGGAGNDLMQAGGGDDFIIGGEGNDHAVYVGSRGGYTVTATETGYTVADNIGNEGIDTVIGIERLSFSDLSVAYDIGDHAGSTAKILGAVFGASAVSNTTYAGIGLKLLDEGMSYESLMTLAINTTGAATPRAVVDLLWNNVVGGLPSDIQAQPFVDMLNNGWTVGQLGVLAADTELNQANINLIGLAQTGLEYIMA